MSNRRNLGMFGEHFRQLKVIGILVAVIGALAGIFMPILSYIYVCQGIKEGYDVSWDLPQEIFVFMTVVPYILMVLVPLLMFMVFSYLNKRNSCDFYHAIPVKKHNLLLSGVLAVFVWTVIWVVVYAGTFCLMTAVLPKIYIEWKGFGVSLLRILAEVIMIIGVFLLGISISGTVFTGLISSIIIIVAPRLILIIIALIIDDNAPLLVGIAGIGIFNYSYNIIWRILSETVTIHGTSEYLTCIYSIIVGLIYGGVGSIAFIRRKSETASQPSVNRLFQSIMRMIPAYIITLIATMLILNYAKSKNTEYEYRPEFYFFLSLIYVIAVLVFIIYELITSRKWKAVVKSLKQLPILFALNIVTTLAIFGAVNKINSYSPDIGNVDSITIKTEEYGYYYSSLISYYLSGATSETEELIQMAVDGYNYAKKCVESNEYSSIYSPMNVVFNEGGKKYSRSVYFSNNDYNDFINALLDEVKFEKKEVFPSFNTQNIYVDGLLTPQDMRIVYESFVKEVKDIGMDILLNNKLNQISGISYINITYPQKTYDISERFAITSYTPKTMQLFLELSKKSTYYISIDDFVDKITDFDYSKDDSYIYADFSMEIIDNAPYGIEDINIGLNTTHEGIYLNTYDGDYILNENKDKLVKVYDILKECSTDIEDTGYMIIIYCSYESGNALKNEYVNQTRTSQTVYCIDKEKYDELMYILYGNAN